MPGYCSEVFHTELSALIERRPVDATNPLDRFDPDSIIANSKDKEEGSQSTSTGFLDPVSTDLNRIEPQPLLCQSLFTSPSLSYPAIPDNARPCGMDYQRSDSTTPFSVCAIPPNDSNRNVLDADPSPAFHHCFPSRSDTILHWYGQNHRSSQEESLQHDKALLEEYIRRNIKLTAQLAFMRKQRKKKQTDSNLVDDYRFMVSLFTAFKTLELKPPPRKYVTSKAILICLDVTASWLSRAKHVIKLLDKIGPDGPSPDPLIVKRLQSKELTHKGSDLLTFLKQRESCL